MTLNINADVRERFLGLRALTCQVKGVKVKRRSAELEKLREEIVKQVRERYDLESLKDLPTFRAYRNFFWRAGIDPTKNRPAAEALIRRILRGRPIPQINTLVDAYNLASIKTEVALAAFDLAKLKGSLLMRQSEKGEVFLGIGMKKPMVLRGGEIVVSDDTGLVAVYPHRDAENSKVTEATKDVILMVCGVPHLKGEVLSKAAKVASEYIIRFCGGEEKAFQGPPH